MTLDSDLACYAPQPYGTYASADRGKSTTRGLPDGLSTRASLAVAWTQLGLGQLLVKSSKHSEARDYNLSALCGLQRDSLKRNQIRPSQYLYRNFKIILP